MAPEYEDDDDDHDMYSDDDSDVESSSDSDNDSDDDFDDWLMNRSRRRRRELLFSLDQDRMSLDRKRRKILVAAVASSWYILREEQDQFNVMNRIGNRKDELYGHVVKLIEEMKTVPKIFTRMYRL